LKSWKQLEASWRRSGFCGKSPNGLKLPVDLKKPWSSSRNLLAQNWFSVFVTASWTNSWEFPLILERMWNWFCVFVRCKINHGKFWGTLVQKQTSHKFALILGRIGNWLCVFVRRKCKSKVVCVDKRKNQGKFGSKLIFCVFSKTRKFPRICSSGYFKDLEIKYVPKPTNIYYLPNLPSLRAGLRSRKESEAFGWSWNRIPKYTRSRSRIFQPTPTPEVQLIHFLHRIPKFGNPTSWLLKWYKFFSNFYCNREDLLCSTISVDC